MTSRARIAIEVDGSIFAIRGYRAHGLALGAGLRPTFSGTFGAWIADTKRLPDLTAYLQYRNVPFEVQTTDQRVEQLVNALMSSNSESDEAPPTVGTSEPELDLFGGVA